MSTLRIFSDSEPARPEQILTELKPICDELRDIGVVLERWDASRELAPDATSDDVLDAYRAPIAQLTATYGIKSVDVFRITADHPQLVEMRDKFLHEHTHDDFEIRFFVAGQAVFYLHCQGRVYAMLCTRGDLLSVPAHVKHWFDMGPQPNLTAIRMFTTPDGWVARFTGDAVAARFPTMDVLES